MEPLVVNSELVIPAHELEFVAVRASGPGGQNVNKVSSKIVLRFDFIRSTVISEPQRAALAALPRRHLDSSGSIAVTSSRTRDQQRNLDDARRKLADLINKALTPPRPRKKTSPPSASLQERLETKRRQSEKKRRRRPPDYD